MRYRGTPRSIGNFLLVVRAVVSVVCLTILLVGCTSEGVSRPSASASTSSIAKPMTSTAPPVRNAEGEITGDPFAQCEITQSTAQPDPPYCVGNPRFEWERAPTVEPREGGGWLTEGILLSDPNEPWITVGFRLSEDCIVGTSRFSGV